LKKYPIMKRSNNLPKRKRKARKWIQIGQVKLKMRHQSRKMEEDEPMKTEKEKEEKEKEGKEYK